ncbi:VOC family protein [Schinkia sp. CFF1]
MTLNVYLTYNGNCREAVEFYGNVFGAEPKIMTLGDAPPNPNSPVSEEAKNLVMHAELTVQGSRVMCSDNCSGSPFHLGNNITLAIVSNNVDELKTYFNKLKEGGKVEMELQETFFSKCFGKVTDKFGISWQLSFES